MLALTSEAAKWFLPFAIPISLWVAWSDLKFMKIPNKAVLALTLTFVIVGFFVLPLTEYLWRYLHLVVVLVIGFALNMARLIGAGDAKFAAAMAPFVPLADFRTFRTLFVLVLIAAFITHRVFRAIPFARNMAPDWVSWGSKKFPMGTALGGGLSIYLIFGFLYGA